MVWHHLSRYFIEFPTLEGLHEADDGGLINGDSMARVGGELANSDGEFDKPWISCVIFSTRAGFFRTLSS